MQDSNGYTALHLACPLQDSEPNMLQLLLTLPFVPWPGNPPKMLQRKRTRSTSLHWALIFRNRSTLRCVKHYELAARTSGLKLLDRLSQEDLNTCALVVLDADGTTFLHMACSAGYGFATGTHHDKHLLRKTSKNHSWRCDGVSYPGCLSTALGYRTLNDHIRHRCSTRG